MSEGLGTFVIDTRDMRAMGEVVDRSRVRVNRQDPQNPNWEPLVRNISMLDPYRDPASINTIYNRAMAAVRQHVSQDANVLAGRYGLVISAFAQTDRPNVVTINIGHGNFLSNQSFSALGELDSATRAGLTYVASLVQQIRQSNPGASIVLMGAFNGGTIANLASVTLGLPAVTFMSNPLSQSLVDASVNYITDLSVADPTLVSPAVAADPYYNAAWRVELTPFQTVDASDYIFETLRLTGTEAFSYDDSLLRQLNPLIGGLENAIGPAKAAKRLREGLEAFAQEMAITLGEDAAKNEVGDLLDAVARGDRDAAYAIAGGNERALEWLSDLSWSSFGDSMLILNQSNLSELIAALGSGGIAFGPGNLPSGFTPEQFRLLRQGIFAGNGVSQYAQDETTIGYLRSAINADPDFINRLVSEDGFHSVTSIISGSSFLKNNSIFGRFSKDILLSLRGGPEGDAIATVIQRVEGGARFDRLLWQFTSFMVEAKGVEPNRQDIETFYASIIGKFDDGGSNSLTQFLGEVLSVGPREQFFEQVSQFAFDFPGNSAGSRPMENTCFPAGTKILSANGKNVCVENLQVGDSISCYDEGNPFGPLITGTVSGIVRRKASKIVTINGLRCTHDHKLLNADGNFQAADSFRVGSHLINSDGERVEVSEHIVEDADEVVFAITVAPHATLVAEGLRVHNEARCSIYDEFFRLDENLAIKTNIHIDGTVVMEYIDGRGVKTGERIISDKVTLERIYKEYIELNGLEERDGDGVYRPKLPPAQIEEIYRSELRAHEDAEMFGSLGNALGSILGERIAGQDVALGVVLKGTLGTALENIFEAASVGHLWSELPLSELEILGNVEVEFSGNLTGAVSSYLIAELIAAVGIDGVPGEVLQTSAGSVVSTMVQNIINGTGAFDGIGGAIGNSIGSFIGTKLASEIISFDTIGGQIGSSLGASAGSIFGAKLITAAFPKLLSSLSWAGGPVGAAVGAFLGFMVGGLIGSIFGGTPRSGADVKWDERTQQFTVANVYSKKGGSKESARSIAAGVADSVNSILNYLGGVLENPESIQVGNYGMRGKAFVYRPYSTREKSAITMRFSGANASSELMEFGLKTALTDSDFNVWGGSVIIKRAFYNYIDRVKSGQASFDNAELFGNLASASSFEAVFGFLPATISLASVSSGTVEAAEFAIALARGHELGLDKRARSDWFGGFGYLKETSGFGYDTFDFKLSEDTASGQLYRKLTFGEFQLQDLIATGAQDRVVGSSANDVIDARGGDIDNIIGLTVNGKFRSDIALDAADFSAGVQQISFSTGSSRTTTQIGIISDQIFEKDEKFTLEIGESENLFIADRQGVVTIAEKGSKAHLIVGDSYVATTDSYVVFRISLSKSVAGVVSSILELASADGDALSVGMEVSANGVDNWVESQVAVFSGGVTELFVRVPVSAVSPRRPSNSASYELGVVAEINLKASAVAGLEFLAESAETSDGTGRIIEDGDNPRNFVWIDDVVVHEESGTSFASIGRSRAAAGASVTVTAREDRSLRIAIAASIDGGAGSDTIYASDNGDNLIGGSGSDLLYGGRLDDWLFGGDGDDVLDAGTANALALGGDGNYLTGGAGNDILRGREGSDWLEGGDGIDTITGGAGDDILTGGAGDGDDLKGGVGNDQYLIRLGDGADIAEDDATGAPVSNGTGDAITQRMAAIEAWKLNPLAAGAIRPDWIGATSGVQQGVVSGGEDAVVFGAGIGIGDIRMQRSGTSAVPGNDLVIQVMQTDPATGLESFSGTQLTIKDWFSNPFKRVEWLKFADGTEIRVGDITSFIVGGSGDDVLIGTAGNDFVYGGAGDDQLFLLGGDDVGNGASGNDLVWGDEGRDLLIGGTGNDELLGGAGADAISGDAGADYLYGAGDRDILSGGRGDGDLVIGGAGDDIFKFSRGDGRDTYFDDFSDHWEDVWTSAGQWNTAGGYHYDALTGEVTGPGGVVLRKNFGTATEPDFQWVGGIDYDSVTGSLKYFNPPAGAAITANSGIDTIEFAPGINLQDVILCRSGDDLVMAVASDDLDVSNIGGVTDSITIKDWYLSPGQIEKLAFYATGILDVTPGSTNLVAGTDGVDGSLTTPLAGSAIADWMTAGAGDDVVAGGAGNDIIAGNSGSDVLRGQSGNDVLYGGTGNDILDGGSGKDILIGGSGLDTASYASAASAIRVRLSRSSNNGGDAAGDEYDSIENVTGGSAADNIGGDEGDNTIDGGSGADLLMGGAGEDTYIWSPSSGADTIREGAFTVDEAVTASGVLANGYTTSWTNTGASSGSGKYYWRLEIHGPDGELVYDYALYSYAAGTAMPAPAAWNTAGWKGGFAKTNGQQVTRDRFDTSVSGGGDDTIEFAAGVSLSDLTFIRALGGVANASGPDLIIRYNGSAATQITIKNHFTVYGGVEALQFNDGQAVSLASILSAASSAALHGTSADDLIVGQSGAGVDALYGGVGDDVLSGLAGDDALYGEDGDDVLEGGAGADRLDGGANAVDGDGDTVRYVNSAAVTIDLGTTAAQSGGDAEGDTLFGIENVVGSKDGGDTITGDAGANRIDALDGDNIIDGLDGDDVLVSGAGADTIRGGAGEDNISAGDGSDQVWGGDDNDIVVGGGGNDQLRGDGGNDQLFGSDGNDTVLDGGVGDDKIYGEAGNDTLTGGDGNDLLAGGSGADILNGGVGDDVYFVQSNDGADIITDTSGANIVSFDTGISHDRIWMTQSGSNLKIGVIGEDTVLTIANFFSSTGATRIREVLTSTHAIFLDHPDTLNLIAAMTAASVEVPMAVPSEIAEIQARYWHEGGKARPIAPAEPRIVTTNEDSAVTIDGNYGVIDHDNNIVGYQLKEGAGPTSGTITGFDPVTGALTYTPDAEANGSDSFVVIVTDADNQSVEVPVHVTVAPVNDAPRSLAVKDGAVLEIAESAPGAPLAVGTVIGLFESIDIEGDAVSFSLVNDAGGRFAMTANGTLTLADPSGINFEAATSHVVRVRVTDEHGASSEQDFTVAVLDRNEANGLPAAYSMTVAENSAVGVVVGLVAASDLDLSGAFAAQRYYFWNGTTASAISNDGRYAINATTGQISVNGPLNFEGPSPSKSYQVIVRDNAGNVGYNQAQTTVTIGIVDANEANSLPASYNWSVNENVALGTAVGTVAASDTDGAGTAFAQQRYYFWDDGAVSAVSSDGRYAIDAISGIISTNAALDFEAGTPSATYQVVARDNAGDAGFNQVQTAVTIGISNVNEANSLPATYNMAVNENVAVGTVVGTVAASDLDQSGAFASQRYYFWDGTTASATSSDGRYAINATTGQITVAAALNFEAGTPTKTYQVIARDNAGAAGYKQAQSAVTIGINDLNEAPISLNWTPTVGSVAERDHIAGEVTRPAIALGTLSVTDPDTAGLPNATYSYALSDSRFEIVGSTLRLKQDASFDYEAGASVTVTVTGTDGTGTPFTISRAIAIAVTNIDDIFEGTSSADTIIGQSGRDIISGFAGNDTLSGGSGNDQIDGGDGADLIKGQDGDDTLLGQVGADTIYGGAGNDTLRGGNDDDRLFGEAGNDLLYGEAGSEGVRAAGTSSWRGFTQAGLVGGDGNDLLDGGIGDDYLDGGAGADQLIGGDGFDGVDYSASNAAVTVNLATGTGSGGHAQGDALSGIELVQGSAFGDTITGSAGSDVIYGGAGNDLILGGAGNDYLFGGDGNDTINAEAGDDVLDGGAGDDILNGGIDNDLYIVTRSSGADTINNYDPSGDDIDLIGFNDATGAINDQDLWFERIGDDLKISVIGTTSSVQVTNWYGVTDANSRANHQIDFIVAGTAYSRTLNIEGLVGLMATKTKPATAAARDTLMADLNYKAMWATYWNSNATPTLTAIAQQATNEDVAKSFSVTATDDITPGTQIQLSAEVISGTNVVTNAGISFGTPNASGVRTMTINPVANANGTARIRVTATDAGGISTSREFNIVVNAVADTPTITQFTSAGGTSGQAGGIPLALNVSYPDGDGSETHEIWITGVPSGLTLSAGTYDSASSTWKLTQAQLVNLKLNAPVGWSSDPTLTATARATENGQTAVSAAVQLTVSVNAPPTGASLNGSVNENAANGTAVGTVVGTDPDNDAMTYSMVNSAGGRFAVNAAGAVMVANGTLLNFETTTSHSITVRITDTRGAYIDRSFAIAVKNVNEANSLPSSYSMSVNENVAVGTLVGTVKASDLDSSAVAYGQQRYYFLNGTTASGTSSDGRYSINATTGQIKVAGALNFEAGTTSVAYTVIARDNAGGAGYKQAQTTVTIAVANVNEQNSLPASYSFAVNENLGIGTAVGTVLASDPDGAGTFASQRYYFLNGTTASAISSDGRYQINATTGKITTNAVLNYEAGTPSGTYTVIARDNAGVTGYKQAQTSVTIAVKNVNEANSLPASYSMSVNENVAVGTLVGTVAASDIDSSAVAYGQQRYYFLNGTTVSATSSDGRYTINATTGKITTKVALNYEAGSPSATYTVIARDNAGAAGYKQAQTSVTIGIKNLNEANSIGASFSFGVNENVAVGTLVGTVAASDIDSSAVAYGQQRYYFLNGTTASATSSDGRYTINATTGQITTRVALNYEAGTPSATYTVIARDNAGGAGYHQVQTNVTIGIRNLNEANSITTTGPFYVAENKAVGTVVGTVTATDLDSSTVAFGQQRYYFLNGTTASATSSDGRYTIDATTGQIKVKVTLDYDTGTPSGTYTVIARDNAGAAGYRQASKSITINITNINEAHTLKNAAGSRAEGDYPDYPVVSGTNAYYDLRSLMLSDPENGPMTWTFVDGKSTNGIWSIEGSTGRLYLTAGEVDYEAVTTRYETSYVYDPYFGMMETTVPVRDHSLATQQLSIKATDGTHSATGTFTATITDVNEGPQLNWSPRYIVRDDQGEGYFATLYGTDPETGAAAKTYTITNIVKTESHLSPGSSSDVDNSGNPTLSVGYADGKLSFAVPGDGEWEGGIKNHPTLGGRWYYQLDYQVTVRMTDASGVAGTSTFTVTFLKHGTSTVLPIMFDLDGDGIELVGYENSAVAFDMDLDGIADRTGWVGADDGMLVIDRNGNGTIDDASEISFVGDAPGAATDLEGLRAYDTDKDGYFDTGDVDFGNFLIWRDVNQDGVSQAGELKSLTEWGIRAINLSMTLTGQDPDQEDNVIFATTDFEKTDGTTGAVGDVFLKFAPSDIDDIAAPIVLDFDGDGAGLVTLAESKTRFDMNGDGIADKTGWIEQGDAFLALDRNANGKIDDVSEISFVGDKEGAKTDLEGLAAFDSNGDGVLNGDDARFAEFRLWFDSNSNGETDAGELLSLAEAGVAAIDLSGVATGETATSGKNIVYNKGIFTRVGGGDGELLDVGLAFKAMTALPDVEFQTSSWGGKSERYRLNASGGNVRVVPRYPKGPLAAEAGQVAGAAMISTRNGDYGLLSTILLDIDGDGLEAKRASKSKARFDMNGDGLRDDTGWASGGDGMLVIDRDNDGKISHASELSFLSEKEDAKNSWEGLAALDSNKDGKLDKNDARFGELKVWSDGNGDGISQVGELKTLAELSIAEIGLRNAATSDSVKLGRNLALSTATFKRENGTTATIGSVALGFEAAKIAARSPGLPTGPYARRSIDELDAARAASNLAQAMSRFGIEASADSLRNLPNDGMAPHDWLAAAVA
ncbi:cadherin domain-containing protein [Sphingopyxis indica]|uniref:cadherin domain-containing protein n=1 Tax=Sphingopyxis indica TaxID=436663 RepID=UPI00293906DE|nr:cadherin domain-containing protein [Sphingopyxis indica]WOF43891.1 cadherin domain-containing protein [Sphingopyxis indica]